MREFLTQEQLYGPEVHSSRDDDSQKLKPLSFLHSLQAALPVGESPLPSSCYCFSFLGESTVSFRSFLGFVSRLLTWPHAFFIFPSPMSLFSIQQGLLKFIENNYKHLQHNSHWIMSGIISYEEHEKLSIHHYNWDRMVPSWLLTLCSSHSASSLDPDNSYTLSLCIIVTSWKLKHNTILTIRSVIRTA